MLVHLNVWNARVRDVPSRPVYGVGERSGIKIRKVVPRISWLLLKGFLWRLREKYVIRDFHPLVFFYVLGFVMTLAGLALGIAETVLRIMGNGIPAGDGRAGRAAPDRRQPVHALRDVVRHGVEQGPALAGDALRERVRRLREDQARRAEHLGAVAQRSGDDRTDSPPARRRSARRRRGAGRAAPRRPPPGRRRRRRAPR